VTFGGAAADELSGVGPANVSDVSIVELVGVFVVGSIVVV
jgi:hypothetical protein